MNRYVDSNGGNYIAALYYSNCLKIREEVYMREEQVRSKTIEKVTAVLFGISILFLGMLLCVKPVCGSTISKVFIEDAVIHRVFDVVYEKFPDISTEQLDSIDKALKKSPELEKMASKYLDATAESINDTGEFNIPDTNENFNKLNQLVIQAVEQETGIQMEESEQGEFTDQLELVEQDVQEILQEIPFFIQNFGIYANIALKLYGLLTSKILLAIVILINGILGAILINTSKQKWIKTMGIIGIIDGVVLGFFIPLFIKWIGFALTNRLLGRTSELEVMSLYITGGVLCVSGVLLLLGRYFRRLAR